ncbi:hypothetical protein Pth03_25440 [Planotetraspora thailandica]|uniref:PadR family transcriptional regulator n=1 Tax=Planotetraspora thailandica TaxID=487172 RepID=A0A8J3XVM9_9ACTN|nr:hypothetical protein [Planotetraspora thailandica]GII54155.1 hypothetical protein Pth03_25440 [Planotetraspora thailandica]
MGGRRRRTYELTEQGRLSLNGARDHWQEFAAAVSAALRSAPWPTTN